MARIKEMTLTGRRGRSGLIYRFDLLVSTDTHGQYDDTVEEGRKSIRYELATPGATVPVRVGREDRRKVAIDWSAKPAREIKRARVAAEYPTPRRTVRRVPRHR
jgi:hypothetical protein